MKHFLIPLLAAVLVFLPVAHAEEKLITWAVIELPPVSMFTIPNPEKLTDLGNGSTDIALRAIAAHLPDYQHRVIIANVPEILAKMSAAEPVCVGSALRTPLTEKFAYFTERGITPPPNLIIRKKDVEKVTGGAATISLKALMQRKDVIGSIVSQRPYTPAIDALVQQAQSQSQSQLSQVPSARYSSILKLLDAGLIDYTIEFSYVAEYFNRQGMLQNELIDVPLEEATDPMPVVVMCTKSAWGAQAIRDIDKAIRAAVSEKELRQALLQWLPAPLQSRIRPQVRCLLQAASDSADTRTGVT